MGPLRGKRDRHTGRTLHDSEGRDCSYVASNPGTLSMADNAEAGGNPITESEREGERESMTCHTLIPDF